LTGQQAESTHHLTVQFSEFDIKSFEPAFRSADKLQLDEISVRYGFVGVIAGFKMLKTLSSPLVICNLLPFQISLRDTEYFYGKNHEF